MWLVMDYFITFIIALLKYIELTIHSFLLDKELDFILEWYYSKKWHYVYHYNK